MRRRGAYWLAAMVALTAIALIVGAHARVSSVTASQGEKVTISTDLVPEEVPIPDGAELDLYLSNGPYRGLLSGVAYDQQSREYRILRVHTPSRDVTHSPLALSDDAYVDPDVWVSTDAAGRTWFATVRCFGYIEPGGGATEIVVPDSLTRFPRDLTAVPPAAVEGWREQRITGMAVDDKGRVWLSRDYSLGMLVYEPRDASWRVAQGPADDQVVSVLGSVNNRVLASTVRGANLMGFTQTSHFVGDPDGARWHDLGMPGRFVGAASGRFEFLREEDESLLSVVASAPASGARDERGTPFPRRVVKIGRQGDVWTQPNHHSFERRGPNGSRVWEVPVELFQGSAGLMPVWPNVTSAAVDDEGRLWMAVQRQSGKKLVVLEP